MLKQISTGLAVLALLAGPASAQGMDPATAAVQSRQAHMELLSFFLGTVGPMAQGRTDYDAATATAAAAGIAALTGIDPALYWVEGTAQGEVDGSKSLPAVWSDADGFAAAYGALASAAANLAAEAGNGPDALKAAFGPVGASCGGCHQAYRGR